jgi:hypothetical protein
MDKFLDVCNQPKLNQEDICHLNRFAISNETEAVIKSLPIKKNPMPGTEGGSGERVGEGGQ